MYPYEYWTIRLDPLGELPGQRPARKDTGVPSPAGHCQDP